MKLLVLINEDFNQMHLGQNTSLSYILAGISLGFDVAIFDLSKNILPSNSSAKINAIFLDKNSQLAQNLVKKYQEFNGQVVELLKSKNLSKLANFKTPIVLDLLKNKLEEKEFLFSDFDKIIQRLEPMKKPFPPLGNVKIDDVFLQLQKLLPNKIFNCPINLSDKKAPLEINEILKNNIATPTNKFTLNDLEIAAKLDLAVLDYQKIYQNQKAKIVIKPENSAQSLGVFAIEFSENGEDLKHLESQMISEILNRQIYQIKQGLTKQDLAKIVKILCFVQNVKSDQNFNQSQKIENLELSEITKIAQKLYNDEILAQPFIEGIKLGDVRANIVKNIENNFYCLGFTYRKSLEKKSDDFTTGYSSNKSIPLPITYLSKIEQENLRNSTNQIIEILNTTLRQKYANVTELGFDFLIVGDEKNILLGEINHHCVGLSPISEAMNKVIDDNNLFEGGLGFAKNVI